MLRGAIVLTTVLAVLGLAWLAKSYIDGVDRKGYERGVGETLLKVAQRDNTALVAAQKRIEELKVHVQKLESDHAAAIAKIDEEKTKEVRNVEARKERFVSDVVAGRIRLFDPGARHATCPSGGGGEAAAPGAGTGVGDGTGGAELSPTTSGFLAGEAGRADKVVLKLQACQQILVEDRKVCR